MKTIKCSEDTSPVTGHLHSMVRFLITQGCQRFYFLSLTQKSNKSKKSNLEKSNNCMYYRPAKPGQFSYLQGIDRPVLAGI